MDISSLPIVEINIPDDLENNVIHKSQKIHYKCVRCGKDVIIGFYRRNIDIYKKMTCRLCNIAISRENNKDDINYRIKVSLLEYFSNDTNKENVLNKRKTTKLRIYGDENFNNRKKSRLTCIDKYGVDNPSKSQNIKKTKTETYLKHYGCEHFFKTEKFKQYRKDFIKNNPDFVRNNLKKTLNYYGGKYYISIEDCKIKSKQTKLERYGNENFVNPKKAKQTKLERYGDENFVNSEKAKQTSLSRYGTEYPIQNEEILKRQREGILKNIHNRRTKYCYLGQKFDSLYEVFVYEYCIDHMIPIMRNTEISFTYYANTPIFDKNNNVVRYDMKSHIYIPDFIICGRLVEIKGDHFFDSNGNMCNPYDTRLNDVFKQKHLCGLNNNVIFWFKSDLIFLGIFDYITNKYSTNLQSYYDKYSNNPKINNYKECGILGYTPFNIDINKKYQEPIVGYTTYPVK